MLISHLLLEPNSITERTDLFQLQNAVHILDKYKFDMFCSSNITNQLNSNLIVGI